MKTFAEFIPTLTAREREIVEAYRRDQEKWQYTGCEGDAPYDLMLSTTPAKEPASVDGTCAGYGLPGANGMLSVVRVLVDVLQDEGEKAGIKKGDRVRVIRIEEAK